MVHGNYYGVQYEIYLNKQLNLFDDILPICIDVRKMILLEDNKLVIIPYMELGDRFIKIEHVKKYVKSMDNTSYNYRTITRKTNPELFKYQDVKIYTKYIKHSKAKELEPYTEEQFKKLEDRAEELESKYYEIGYLEKYSLEERTNFDVERSFIVKELLPVQRIMMNNDYFEEIKKMERELTDIKLTETEEELITRILKHPKLEGSVSSHGMTLIDGFF